MYLFSILLTFLTCALIKADNLSNNCAATTCPVGSVCQEVQCFKAPCNSICVAADNGNQGSMFKCTEWAKKVKYFVVFGLNFAKKFFFKMTLHQQASV